MKFPVTILFICFLHPMAYSMDHQQPKIGLLIKRIQRTNGFGQEELYYCKYERNSMILEACHVGGDEYCSIKYSIINQERHELVRYNNQASKAIFLQLEAQYYATAKTT